MGATDAWRDAWSTGDSYDAYVGRWSRLVAPEFLRRLGPPAGARWLDVGCGTGALTELILATASPVHVLGIDPSEQFLRYAATRVADPRASFMLGDARSLPVGDASCDLVVSALSLNFVPEPAQAVAEMRRAACPGGTVASYVWDYSGVDLMTRFWDAAVALDPSAARLHEAVRFDFCRPEPLERLFVDGGLGAVAVEDIVVPTVFVDFDDYWTPFEGGQGPAPTYLMSLSLAGREALREEVCSSLPTRPDGSIALRARAWVVRGLA